MSKDKVYPNHDHVLSQAKLVMLAVIDLVEMNIEVRRITFRRKNPMIEVANCPGIHKIKSMGTGQGVNSNGDRYLTRSSVVCGCEVSWQEVL